MAYNPPPAAILRNFVMPSNMVRFILRREELLYSNSSGIVMTTDGGITKDTSQYTTRRQRRWLQKTGPGLRFFYIVGNIGPGGMIPVPNDDAAVGPSGPLPSRVTIMANLLPFDGTVLPLATNDSRLRSCTQRCIDEAHQLPAANPVAWQVQLFPGGLSFGLMGAGALGFHPDAAAENIVASLVLYCNGPGFAIANLGQINLLIPMTTGGDKRSQNEQIVIENAWIKAWDRYIQPVVPAPPPPAPRRRTEAQMISDQARTYLSRGGGAGTASVPAATGTPPYVRPLITQANFAAPPPYTPGRTLEELRTNRRGIVYNDQSGGR